MEESTTESSKRTTATAQAQRPTDQPSRPNSPPGRPRVPAASRLQCIRGQYEVAGISGWAAELLLARWSKGTNMAYQSGWSKWISF